jgi:hypothetical protein
MISESRLHTFVVLYLTKKPGEAIDFYYEDLSEKGFAPDERLSSA